MHVAVVHRAEHAVGLVLGAKALGVLEQQPFLLPHGAVAWLLRCVLRRRSAQQQHRLAEVVARGQRGQRLPAALHGGVEHQPVVALGRLRVGQPVLEGIQPVAQRWNQRAGFVRIGAHRRQAAAHGPVHTFKCCLGRSTTSLPPRRQRGRQQARVPFVDRRLQARFGVVQRVQRRLQFRCCEGLQAVPGEPRATQHEAREQRPREVGARDAGRRAHAVSSTGSASCRTAAPAVAGSWNAVPRSSRQ